MQIILPIKNQLPIFLLIIFDGFIEENKVICPAHGWEFDLETGKQPGGRKGLRVFETFVSEKKLFVKVVPQTFNW